MRVNVKMRWFINRDDMFLPEEESKNKDRNLDKFVQRFIFAALNVSLNQLNWNKAT